MSAESGPDQPKKDWEKVRLLKTDAGKLWYRTTSGEVVVLDDAAEAERDRQSDHPDTPPADGFPEFSSRIGTEELPITDPNEIEQKRADMQVFINNIVDIDTETRTHYMEELVAAEDDGDLEALRAGIQQMLDEKAAAARAAAGGAAGAAPGGGTAGTPGGAAAGGAGPTGTPPQTPEELRVQIRDRELERIRNKKIIEDAKAEARNIHDAELKAEKTADAAFVFAEEVNAYKTRYEKLRIHGIIDDTTAAIAKNDIDQVNTKEELESRFDTELKGLERRLPETPPASDSINVIASDVEFARLTVEAINNIEAVLEQAGGDPNSMYERYRRRLNTADIRRFDDFLQQREARTGKDYGINFSSMTPAERMRRKNPTPVLPSWAGNYLRNTDGTRSWFTHRAEKYGDMEPLSIEAIRSDPKKDRLFGEFLMAVDNNNTILQTIAAGRPLDNAQRQLLEYCQYEFTYQYKRAEALSEMLTPEFVKKLMQHDDFMRSVTVMYGIEKTQVFLKEDVFNIAVRDRGTFDRLALAAWKLNRMGQESPYNRTRRGEEQAEMADVLADRLQDPAVQTALQSEAVGGTKASDVLGGIHALAASEVSTQKMQELFDRDKMKEKIDGRGWDKWTQAEKSNYHSNWKPEEVRKATDKKELGFFAQVKNAFMETLFAKSKKEVKAH